MTFTSDGTRYTVEYLEDNLADFGWYKHLVIAKGDLIENIAEEQIFDDPRLQR